MSRGGTFESPRFVVIERWGFRVVGAGGAIYQFSCAEPGGDGIQENRKKAFIGFVTDEGHCPRCGGRKLKEVDCGPDGYDDDITYTSDVCEDCGLWYSGWSHKWLVDVTCWQDEEDAEEFIVDVVRAKGAIKVMCPFAPECRETDCEHRVPHKAIDGVCTDEPYDGPNPMEGVAEVPAPEPGEAPCVQGDCGCKPVKEQSRRL